MKTHKFTITLGGVTYITSELVDKLYEAGCNDGLISQTKEVVTVMFDREAISFEQALQDVINQIEYIVLNDGSEVCITNVVYVGSE